MYLFVMLRSQTIKTYDEIRMCGVQTYMIGCLILTSIVTLCNFQIKINLLMQNCCLMTISEGCQ